MVFVRGTEEIYKNQIWDRVYISSIFTYDLPKTVKTINYYSNSVNNAKDDIIVGGIGATLIPEYVVRNSNSRVITGPLDYPDALGFNEDPISDLIPDYDLIKTVDYKYVPENAYFGRISLGCIRKCKFCAVPILEPDFRYLSSITSQVNEIIKNFGEKNDLVILDNNILALPNIIETIQEIKNLGFERGAKIGRKSRYVDFNQGIDARLITPEIAKELGTINIRPIRLAFDNMAVEKNYRKAISLLSNEGFKYFTTYIMYNFEDNPKKFYERLKINIELSKEYDIRITGFPMRFVPINNVNRQYISKEWNWKFLRGIQCVLNATHGMVSPLSEFFDIAFGRSYSEFIEILSMPDNYIIFRNKYREQANLWRHAFSKLKSDELVELHTIFNKHHHQLSNIKTGNNKLQNVLAFYENRGLENI